MILANWPLRANEELHSSTVPSRAAEGLFWPWRVSISSDLPYWRPPRPRSVWSFHLEANGLEARFWITFRLSRQYVQIRSEAWRNDSRPALPSRFYYSPLTAIESHREMSIHVLHIWKVFAIDAISLCESGRAGL